MQNDSVSQQLWAMLCTHKYCYCLYFYQCSPYRLNFQSSSLGLRAGGRKKVRETEGGGRWREGRREEKGVMKEGRRRKNGMRLSYADIFLN